MIEIDSGRPVEVIDITHSVQEALIESKVVNGICLVYTLHTTTALMINEADTALIKDILNLLERLVPQAAGYLHDRSDGNAHAHLRAALLGSSIVIPVEQKRLALGTWQRILFLELDGPRRRKVFVKAVAD